MLLRARSVGSLRPSSSAAGACWQPWEDKVIARAHVGRRLPWHSVEKIKAQLPHRSTMAIRMRSSRLKGNNILDSVLRKNIGPYCAIGAGFLCTCCKNAA